MASQKAVEFGGCIGQVQQGAQFMLKGRDGTLVCAKECLEDGCLLQASSKALDDLPVWAKHPLHERCPRRICCAGQKIQELGINEKVIECASPLEKCSSSPGGAPHSAAQESAIPARCTEAIQEFVGKLHAVVGSI